MFFSSMEIDSKYVSVLQIFLLSEFDPNNLCIKQFCIAGIVQITK